MHIFKSITFRYKLVFLLNYSVETFPLMKTIRLAAERRLVIATTFFQVQWKFSSQAHRKLHTIYNRRHIPDSSAIRRVIEKFWQIGTVVDVKTRMRGRTGRFGRLAPTFLKMSKGNAVIVYDGERSQNMFTSKFFGLNWNRPPKQVVPPRQCHFS